ncbi:MAG: pyridoxal-phosphate dependent enzyme [Gammaproteobacteria bacterium]
MTSTTPPGKKPAPITSDDAWERLTRTARFAQEGRDFDDPGDTDALLTGRRQDAVHVTNTYQRTEMLDLVNASLAAAPDRADLWMMRFEALRACGLKQEFLESLVLGWKNGKVIRQLDWAVLQQMWGELAPGEPLPEIIQVPGVTAAAPKAIAQSTPAGTARIRRFHDIALKIAERELTILGKAYAVLCARPGFVEDFARKVAPLLRRPTPLQLAEGLSKGAGEHVRIFLKREDQRTVSAEFDHAAGQCYVAQQLGRAAVITANDVDAHALAVAEMAPHFKLKCTVVVRAADLQNKAELVAKLKERGAQVEAMNEAAMLGDDPREAAVRLWQKSAGAAHLVLSFGTAPPPYPQMAATFQSLLGRETELQFRAVAGADRARTMVAAVESEADSLGFMLPQLGRKDVELIYAEPEPGGIGSWRASTRLRAYNGAIREHTLLFGTGRIEHVALADATALAARQRLQSENIAVSLEDARAVALTLLMAQRDKAPRDFIVLVG